MTRRFRNLGLINIRLQRNALIRRYSRRAEAAANGIASADSGCDLFGKLLTVRGALGVRGFGGISQETALHEHGPECWSYAKRKNRGDVLRDSLKAHPQRHSDG